jgi:Tfp pilus assembly protein PilF
LAPFKRRPASFLVTVLVAAVGCSRAPTFSHDVAPIIYRRCAPCHRPGGAGPFSLLTYEAVCERAPQIARVVKSRFMPPWKPLPGYAEYANARGLDDAEIETIEKWIAAKTPLGRRDELPPPPPFPSGWTLGKPDLVIDVPRYMLPAEGRDVYRNLVVRGPLVEATRFVTAWELMPGATAVHHAILNVDRGGWARAHDGADGQPGFDGMDPGDIAAPDGFYLVWTPGQAPVAPRAGDAWPLDARTDLVLQLHLQPTGKVETVTPQIALYFGPPPSEPRVTMRIGDLPIDINPGDSNWKMHDEYALPVDVKLLSLFPHAHYLARKMRVWATLPDGKRRWLLAIDDWDPAWQQDYAFAQPIDLPRGSKLEMDFVYDNSESNVRNPNHPPARVKTGERSADEMGNVTFSLALASAADKARMRESKYRRALAMEGTARGHFNLGNALGDERRPDEAVAEYRRALAMDATLIPARANLGVALLSLGDARAAARELAAVVEAQPRSATAHANLGMARARMNDVAGARRELEAALAIDPGLTAARAALAALPK